MAGRWVIYPFVLALYPVIALYAQNVHEARAGELVLPVAAVLGVTAALWGALRLAARDAARAGLLTLVAVVVFDTVHSAPGWLNSQLSWLSGLWVPRDVRVWPWLAVGIELSAALAVLVAVMRAASPHAPTPYLNTFSLVLMALPVARIAREASLEPPRAERPRQVIATARPSGRPPDIYHIILDGYARSDVMKELFGFDNGPFLDRLERKGFYVARQSNANYCQTPLSLASALNASYLNGAFPPEAGDKFPLREWIGDGVVVRTLRGLGYRFVSFATGFTETEQTGADEYLSPYPYVSAFHRTLLERTPLDRLLPNPGLRDSYTMTRERTLFLFDRVPRVARQPGPTFTFAHVVAPHPPFVFDAAGEDVSPRHIPYYLNDGNLYDEYYGDEASYVRGYGAQAEFLTLQVERMIDRILAESPEPPVIVLQSDHGSGLHLDVESPDRTDHRERMGILNAYYFPGARATGVYPTVSPVNSFRLILNAYFGAGLDLLPDRSYYSSWGRPFDFLDVTDLVQPSPSGAPPVPKGS